MTPLAPLPHRHPSLRVLTIDGGPAALLQVHLLGSLEKELPGFLAKTEMFAGTSDGAFLSLFLASRLAKGKTSAAALDEAVPFMRRIIEALHATPWGVLRLVSGLRPLDTSRKLRALLRSDEGYGDMRFGELDRKMLIVSLDADQWKAKLFRNFETLEPVPREPDDTMFLADAALASSAFPMYLPIHGRGDGGHFVDGGLVANNPAMCALANALQYMKLAHSNIPVRHLRDWLPGVRLLSLGALECRKERGSIERSWLAGLLNLVCGDASLLGCPLPLGDVPWGWLDWLVLRPLFLADLTSQGSVEVSASQCRDLLDTSFHRFAPPIEEIKVAMRATLIPPARICADVEAAAKAIAAGPLFQALVAWAKAHWMPDQDGSADG